MKVLVTGANGFIGGHVCRILKEKGMTVIGLDLQEKPKSENLDGYVSWMLSDKIDQDFLEDIQPDAVVHLASDMRHDPGTEIEVVLHNCTGVQHLLELCEKHEVKAYVQLSSLPLIGRPAEHPVTEKHAPHPPTVYHATKRMMELLADFADYTHGLRTVSFRITAPVGIGMNQRTIFPTFVRKAVAGEDLMIYGEGTREQTFIHVSDIAEAIYLAIVKENAHGVYNLSGSASISNLELAKKIIEVTGSSSKLTYSGLPDKEEGVIWDISLERIQTDLGYVPAVGYEEMIRELAEDYQKQA